MNSKCDQIEVPKTLLVGTALQQQGLNLQTFGQVDSSLPLLLSATRTMLCANAQYRGKNNGQNYRGRGVKPNGMPFQNAVLQTLVSR